MADGRFGSIKISAGGMRGQRMKMDTTAQNLANAETTRTEDGTPYRRQTVVFSQALNERLAARRGGGAEGGTSELARTDARHLAGGGGSQGIETITGVKSEVGVAQDASDFKVVYDPGHPDADEDGYVLMPNVNVISEMVDMITASRAYEANVSAVQSAKAMFAKALDI